MKHYSSHFSSVTVLIILVSCCLALVIADQLHGTYASLISRTSAPFNARHAESNGGWIKYPNNPVLGGKLGTCFDVAVLPNNGEYWLYFSWRPKGGIGLTKSHDGIHWGPPQLVVSPVDVPWAKIVNRPYILKIAGIYHLWYTGQTATQSFIGYATSRDGEHWKAVSRQPVLSPDKSWEKVAVMCPSVIYDEKSRQYQMWYSAGAQYEPDAIGYATSNDGLSWKKYANNPIFSSAPNCPWECCKVTACQVVRDPHGFLMFYIGFADQHHAQIGMARSLDGIHNWQRSRANPIIGPGCSRTAWDQDSVYKPFAIFDGKQWLLWYNGRASHVEQIGLATHQGYDLPW